jgi:hypothetical protein
VIFTLLDILWNESRKAALKRTGSASFSKIQIAAPRAIGQYDRMIRHHRGTALSERLGISKVASELAYSSIATTKMFYDHSKLSDAEYLQSVEK